MSDYQNLASVAFLVDAERGLITQVVINKGSDAGVKLGDVYLIFGLGQEIIDPVTQQSLGKLELVRGRAQVTSVQPSMATLTSIEKRKGVSTTRKITRSSLSMAFIMSPSEIVTEEQEPTTKELDRVTVGDYARKLSTNYQSD